MTVVDERLATLVGAYHGVAQQYQELKRQLVADEAQIMRGLMLKIADGDEWDLQVISFRFSANFEYDDEGSYFWTPTINAILVDEAEESVEEVETWSGEESTQLAFEAESQWEGEITVARLRELWETHPWKESR